GWGGRPATLTAPAWPAHSTSFTTNVDDLLDRRMHDAVRILQVDRVDAVDRLAAGGGGADGLELGVVEYARRGERGAAGLAEADRRGLVPDDVVAPQDTDQHDHVHRVDARVEAASKGRAE